MITNPMNTLTKETSKLIADLGIEVVTEKWWVKVYDDNHEVVWKLQSDTTMRIWSPNEEKYPAPSIGETLLALEAIGEKLGWENKQHPYGRLTIQKEYDCSISCARCVVNKRIKPYEYHAQHLTTLFLDKTKGLKAVDAYIAKLLK